MTSSQTIRSEPSVVHLMLLDIWSTTLGHEVTADDNFFEAGGDSLSALITIEQINQRLGWRLNMGDLMRFQTIAELRAHKAKALAANPEKALIRMSNEGMRTPIVFVHAGGGVVDGYARIVRELGTDRACFGLQSPLLLEDDWDVPDSMPELAAVYAEVLQDEIGEEEFHLFGSCSGGAICIEIGRIAAERGLNLGRTVVVDGYLDLHSTGATPENEMLVNFYGDVLRMSDTLETFPELTPRDVDGDQVMRAASIALFGKSVSFEEGEAFCRRLYSAYRSAGHALTSYRPQPVDVDVLMLLARDNRTLDDWRSIVTGDLTAEVLPFDTYGMRLCIDEAPYLAARTVEYLGEK